VAWGRRAPPRPHVADRGSGTTGVGIARDKQALVFEEFYQVDNPGRDRRRGLGLGLAIVQRLRGCSTMPLQLRSAPAAAAASAS